MTGVTQQKPSVGRIVHYVSYGTPGGEYKSQCRAAVITAVYEDPDPADPTTVLPGGTRRMGEVDLCVLNPEGMFFNRVVPQNEPIRAGGTWHWPERI
jgi:hypothetical protein